MDNNFLKDAALSQFNNEMATTRKILERVPFDKFDWKPHAKSMPLGRLAVHVATLPGFGAQILSQDAINFDGKYNPPVMASTDDIVKQFETTSQATRAALESLSDEDLVKTIAFSVMGNKVYEGSRVAAFQTLMMNHLIHHRAQLGVFLRLNDVEIPGSYGPSADEPMKGME